MAKSSQEVRALIEAASSWKAKFAASELERIELVAKTEVATSTAAIMGTKIESLDGDLNSCLEMLRKNHLNLRGHDLATAADKKDFEDLRGRILELKQVHWGGKEDDHGNKQGTLGTPGGSATAVPYIVYQQASKTSLPSIGSVGENLGPTLADFPDTDTTDPSLVSKETEEMDNSYSLPPPTPRARMADKSEFSSVGQEKPEPSVTVSSNITPSPDTLPATPVPVRHTAGRIPAICATPQLDKELPPPPRVH